MGKRKRREELEERREEEEETNLDAGPSSSWTDQFRPKAKKRREEPEDEQEVPLTNGGSGFPRLNGHIQQQDEEQELAVWLVRKPTNLPNDDLYRLRFSRKHKHHIQEIESTERDKKLECRMEKPPYSLLHAATAKESNKKEAMKPNGFLRGVVWIEQSSTARTSDSAITLPPDDGIFVDEDISVDPTETLQFTPIRRKPKTDEQGSAKERLKAYGLNTADKDEEGGGSPSLTKEEEEVVKRSKKRRKSGPSTGSSQLLSPSFN